MFSVGDTIVKSFPFVHVLKNEFLKQKCSWCFESESEAEVKISLKKCSGCKILYFCSISCQKKSWLIHKHECPQLVAHTIPHSRVRLFYHLLIKDNLGLFTKREAPKGRCFNDLKSNPEYLSDSSEANVNSALIYCSNIPKLPQFDRLMDIYLKLITNSFEICIFGGGIYLNISKYGHSCVPNATLRPSGVLQRLVAVKDISPNETITISYIDVLNNKADRQAQLQQYCFTCDCPRCNDESLEAIISSTHCPYCDNDSVDKSNTCSQCSSHMTPQYISSRDVVLRGCLDLMNQSSIDQIDCFLSKWSPCILPRTHMYYTKLIYHKSMLQFESKDYQGALEILETILPRLEFIYGMQLNLSSAATDIIRCRYLLDLPIERQFYLETLFRIITTHGRKSDHAKFLIICKDSMHIFG